MADALKLIPSRAGRKHRVDAPSDSTTERPWYRKGEIVVPSAIAVVALWFGFEANYLTKSEARRREASEKVRLIFIDDERYVDGKTLLTLVNASVQRRAIITSMAFVVSDSAQLAAVEKHRPKPKPRKGPPLCESAVPVDDVAFERGDWRDDGTFAFSMRTTLTVEPIGANTLRLVIIDPELAQERRGLRGTLEVCFGDPTCESDSMAMNTVSRKNVSLYVRTR